MEGFIKFLGKFKKQPMKDTLKESLEVFLMRHLFYFFSRKVPKRFYRAISRSCFFFFVKFPGRISEETFRKMQYLKEKKSGEFLERIRKRIPAEIS